MVKLIGDENVDCHDVQFHAFDLTRNMLDVLEQWIIKQEAKNIEVQQADVLEIETLPAHWKDYDLVISSTMLEYLPKDKVIFALTNLRQLLKTGGILLIFVTKRNWITHWLAEKWWIYDELSFNKYHQNYDRIARVLQHTTRDGVTGTGMYMPFPLGPHAYYKCKH